ncbi:secretin and TonB N-terminal domain-containing protein [bacterium]|nr:secretin and TonB N-terminal domain-containing protein [bacterium]MCI0606018.1 secretin and TonB N-terminal domain-containing protein [bacterium]
MFYRILIMLLLVPALAFSYTIVRKDGKTFQGKLVHESTDEIVLKDEEGVTIKFNKNQIDWDKTNAARRKTEKEKTTRAIELRRERKKEWTGEKISVDFKDVDIRDLFRFLARTGELNLVIHPDVKGNATIKMTDVPWDQVLDIVCNMHDLKYKMDGNVLSITK